LHEFVVRGDGVVMCGGDGHVAIIVFAIDKEVTAGIIDEVAVAAVEVVATWVICVLAEAIVVVYVTTGVVCDVAVVPLAIGVTARIVWEAAAIAVVDALMLPRALSLLKPMLLG